MGLVQVLRQRTAEQHKRAERSGIVAGLLRGHASIFGYAMLLRNLLPAYLTMEASLARMPADDPAAGIARTEVFRGPALRADLLRLAGPDWATNIPVLAAARRYAGFVARADNRRLVAHAYIRYLGDLSGGQILRRLLGHSLGLDDSSLAFYAFPEIGDIESFKSEYRSAIDLAGRDMRDFGPVVEEAVAVFEANIDLSEAIARYVARRPELRLTAAHAPSRGH